MPEPRYMRVVIHYVLWYTLHFVNNICIYVNSFGLLASNIQLHMYTLPTYLPLFCAFNFVSTLYTNGVELQLKYVMSWVQFITTRVYMLQTVQSLKQGRRSGYTSRIQISLISYLNH